MDRKEIYSRIDDERYYQAVRWGTFHSNAGGDHPVDRPKPVESFILYMEDYLQQARHQISREEGHDNALDSLRKVVALGVACFEQHGVPERKLA